MTDVVGASPRTRCEVWTRVMGYHRPVSHFNRGKKSEHYSRKHFTEVAAANCEFVQQYTNNNT
ncbi:MAG: oxidoreductase [Candidatus Magasanikbacteria bacterium]|nr:oxidoreductase [Candidatus Magasanikbacteria bacterium]